MKSTAKLSLAATGLAFATSVAVYPWLPDPMPTHFDLAGHPDGWSSRLVGAFLLPAFMLVMVVIDVARRGAIGAIGAALSLMSVFFLGMHVLLIKAALTGGDLSDTLWLLLGVMLVGLGLLLPRIRRNRWIGVRTPWSMSSDEAWAQSQRMGGYAMIGGGILVAISATMTGAPASALRVLALLGSAVASIAFSYVAARRAS